jgi:glycosyltransferase involved in cell wall biosynthesis
MQSPQPPVVFATPGLPLDVIQVARSLAEAGLLRQIVTTIGLREDGWLKMLPGRIQRRFGNRLLPSHLAHRSGCYPFRELVRIGAGLAGLSRRQVDRIWYWAETGFDYHVARQWAGRAPYIYGCEHASLETFVHQKRRGGRTMLWQMIAHPRFINRVICEQLDRFPETMTPFMRLLVDNLPRSTSRKERQFANSDLVVAISPFVRQTFLDAGYPANRVIAVPSACPPIPAEAESWTASGAKPAFVCAGQLSVRKGIHLLLDAWRRVGSRTGPELLLHGDMLLPPTYHANLPAGASFAPRLSRPALHALFRRSAVFVLPTLAEGRANVVLEALANGLPVITTANSGCTDVVIHGRTGFLIPPGDVDALATQLAWCLDHPRELAEMRPNCLAAVRQWQAADFRREHTARIRQFMSAAPPIG